MVGQSYSQQKKALDGMHQEALEVTALGILLDNVVTYVGFFQKMQRERSTGKMERPGVDLSSFKGWLATRQHWRNYSLIDGLEPGEIASTSQFIIYQRDALRFPPMTHEAQALLQKVWFPRLPALVERLNTHPLTAGLPDAELIMKGGAEFIIRFVE